MGLGSVSVVLAYVIFKTTQVLAQVESTHSLARSLVSPRAPLGWSCGLCSVTLWQVVYDSKVETSRVDRLVGNRSSQRREMVDDDWHSCKFTKIVIPGISTTRAKLCLTAEVDRPSSIPMPF